MARTLGNDEEERIRRILLVGNYIKETGASIRATVKYFSTNFFRISIPTVVDYRNRFISLNPEDALKIKRITLDNTVETLNNPKILERVQKVSQLVEQFTIEEISNLLGESYWTIYNDIHLRLKQINEARYKEIIDLFNNRSKGNLKK